MPTYQYACTSCGENLEVVQKFTDDALTVCPACSGKLRKVYSPVGVVFKGSGFYRNDSRDAKTKSGASSSSSSSSSSGNGNGSSSSNGKSSDSSSDSSSSSSSSSDSSKPAATTSSTSSSSTAA